MLAYCSIVSILRESSGGLGRALASKSLSLVSAILGFFRSQPFPRSPFLLVPPTLSYHIPRSDVHSLSLLCLHHPLPYDSSFPWSSVYILTPALSVTPLLSSLTLPNSDRLVALSLALSIIFPSVSLCHQIAPSSASLFLAHPVRLNAT